MSEIKCIGILTSGGDAPGMNAAIRAVTRSAIFNGFSVKGIMRGYKGLVFNEIVEFKSQSVSNIIQLGGTILKTARCKEFTTPEGRKAAYDNMTAAGIDALVVIGGDGSLTGARLFAQEYNVPIVGLPGTIDNDLGGTDSTIGYDTALNTIMEAVDKLRDTASSHERLFFVEVMGHTAGYLALNSAIATGSEAAIIPEMETEVDQLAELINHGFRKSKNSAIVIVAENPKTGGATALAVADDLGAILVIALFYGGKVQITCLLVALVIMLGVYFMKQMGEKRMFSYLVPAFVVWGLFYYSGVHSTISGVAMALLIPMEPRYSKEYFAHKMRWLNALMLRAASHEDFPNEEQRFYLRRMHDLSSNSVGMSYRLEHALAPSVTFLVMPIFALANAGVEISSLEYLNIFHYSPEIGSIGICLLYTSPSPRD